MAIFPALPAMGSKILGGSIPIPGLNSSASSSASAVSGLSPVYHGDIKSGVNVFVFMGAVLITGIVVWRLSR